MADVVAWVEYAMETEVTNELAQLREQVMAAEGVQPGTPVEQVEDPRVRERVRDVELARSAWSAILSRPEKTRGSVFATAEVVLEAWAHP